MSRQGSGRKKHAEHVNLERWLVSYADFITLMFAFFVIMYAISKADAQRFKIVAQSLHRAFGPAEHGANTGQEGKSGGQTLNQFDEPTPVGGQVIDMPSGKTNVRNVDNAELKRLSDVLEESVSYELGASDLGEKMQILYDERGLVVRLAARGFFDAGQAVVRADALPVLQKIAKVLATTSRPIRVEGHTDAGSPPGDRYPSNWELSTARAAWIVRYMIASAHMDPRLLEAAGYAEFHPIAPNDTPANREKNRRVEILILGK